jgi:predicted TIM-barrel fold metal-dependent hydrolase
MNTRRIVDGHHHLWDLTNHRYPWLQDYVREMWIGDYSPIRRDYLVSDFVRDSGPSGVVKSVHLQAMWDPSDPAGETRWLQECHARHGFPSAVVAYANPAAEGFEALLQEHRRSAIVRGIRMDLNWHQNPLYRFAEKPDYMRQREWLAGFARLEPLGLSFDLQVYLGEQAADAIALVRRFPGVQFILNHGGLPADRTPDGLKRWAAGVAALADHPNVATKVSGFDMFDHRWTVDTLGPVVRTVVEAFGPERAMFASNFPVSGLYRDYSSLVASYCTILSDWSETDMAKFFYDNALRIYRL